MLQKTKNIQWLFVCFLFFSFVYLPVTSSHWSNTTKNKSNRDMIGAVIAMLPLNVLEGSYLPPMGLEAAKMEVRAFNVAWMPALVMEMVCCSIASWMATWSAMSILSNSSMQQIPVNKKKKERIIEKRKKIKKKSIYMYIVKIEKERIVIIRKKLCIGYICCPLFPNLFIHFSKFDSNTFM